MPSLIPCANIKNHFLFSELSFAVRSFSSFKMTTVDYFLKDHEVLVRITPPVATVRRPQDFIASVDVSGSMGQEQSIMSAQGVRESHGFSTLDIVKHALKVKVLMLTANDRFGLVAYHDDAQIRFPLSYMTPQAQKVALTTIEGLQPLNSTNIYDGLEKAFQCFGDEPIQEERIRSVLLYTDGLNNVGPADGPLAAFQRYIARAGLPAQVSINGFGTSTDPVLMRQLADAGGGLYFFTPDAGMVGTTSVNYMANLLVTTATKVKLTLNKDKDGKALNALLAGQPTYVRLPRSCKTFLLNDKSYTLPTETRGVWAPEEYSRVCFQEEVVDTVRACLNSAAYDLSGAKEKLCALARRWSASPYLASDPGHANLFTDVTGELLAALQDGATFDRWGKNYLLAMETAHANGKQTNFKDASLKGYTTSFRETLKTAGNAIFDTLPPPTRSAVSHRSQAAPASMAYYNDDADPCMAGHAWVKTASGGLRVDQVRKGTVLANGAIVQCVVQTLTETPDLVDVGATGTPWITPYHPCRENANGLWRFPCELASITVATLCPAVYSFVLDAHHTLDINGVECIALGHGFTAAKAAHPYLGTDAVLRDLQALPGYATGLLVFQSKSMRRANNLVVGLNVDRLI